MPRIFTIVPSRYSSSAIASACTLQAFICRTHAIWLSDFSAQYCLTDTGLWRCAGFLFLFFQNPHQCVPANLHRALRAELLAAEAVDAGLAVDRGKLIFQDLDFSVTKHPNPYCTQMGLKGVWDTFAPSQPPPLRGRGTPSIFLQTDSPANHNHGSAAHLSAGRSPAPAHRDPPHPPTPSPGRGRRFISTRKDNTHV